MSIKLAMPILLAACALPLSGCAQLFNYALFALQGGGTPRIQKKEERIRAQPLHRRYKYLESDNFETSLAAVWSFREDTPVNDPEAVDHLMANLERWRPPLTDRMRRSMERMKGWGSFQQIEDDTIEALRYVYEYTEIGEVRDKAEAAYMEYRETREQERRKEIDERWVATGRWIWKLYQHGSMDEPYTEPD